MQARESATVLAYRLGWSLARRMPQPMADAAVRLGADAIVARGGRSIDTLRFNLQAATGEPAPERLDAAVRAAMRSYVRYWSEVFRLPQDDPDEIRYRVMTRDEHLMREAYAQGRGVVGVLPHMGNWDLAGAWASLAGMPLVTVAERLRPEPIFEQFVEFRHGLGMRVLPLTGGPAPAPVLMDQLQHGGLVCLLCDRDMSRGALATELLGRTARMPAGPAMLARKAGATLMPITTHYVGDRMRLRFHDPIEHRPGIDGLRRMTQDVADAFTAAIREHPTDWHMLQPVFEGGTR